MNDTETRTQVALPDRPADNEREQKITEGVGMLLAGESYRAAQAATGIPLSTLHGAYHRVCSKGSEQQRDDLDARIIAHAYNVADLAAGEITARLEDPAKRAQVTMRELTTAYGVATDKVALKRRWARPEDTSTDGWLDQLASSLARVRSVTIELNDPADQAGAPQSVLRDGAASNPQPVIDVTPIEG